MKNFKYFIIIALIVLGVSIYGYTKSIPAPEDGASVPKIEISPKDFNFGRAQYGDVLKYDFKLRNLGKEILEITRVATSCACTSAKVVLETINPGQETNLTVTYNTGDMTGSHGRGEQERIIYVRSNDPLNPQEEVMIYANVQ